MVSRSSGSNPSFVRSRLIASISSFVASPFNLRSRITRRLPEHVSAEGRTSTPTTRDERAHQLDNGYANVIYYLLIGSPDFSGLPFCIGELGMNKTHTVLTEFDPESRQLKVFICGSTLGFDIPAEVDMDNSLQHDAATLCCLIPLTAKLAHMTPCLVDQYALDELRMLANDARRERI